MTREAPRQRWIKSSYSGGANNECVEVRFGAASGSSVDVRDSKKPDGGVLSFPPGAWVSFGRRFKR
ncbi:DUF397 domain-containing protein [Saccharothrix sp. CB00851]|uniref:DUF397 domain-containing protein n=1 Tax=Saccharothrix sp. CB00851 TaxID=1835005 RepID=UPI000939BF42|nr:DUF397 domain-containing protein [Saccharothrix sp. CB00851]